jgi:hypothetical protein
MKKQQNYVKKTNLIIFSLTLSIVGLLNMACGNQNQDNGNPNSSAENNQQNSFFCEKNEEKTDIETWNIMYKQSAEKVNPWLTLNQTTINSENIEKSCNEIAQTLDKLKEEGLFKLSYSGDTNNKDNYLLCGETKSNPNNCSLITPLKVTENVDISFQEITNPLQKEAQSYQKTTGGTSVSYSAQESSNVINLTPHLIEKNNPKE